MSYPDLSLLVDGVWITEGRETLPVLEPASGRELGRLPMAREADVDTALAAAARGFEVWRKVPAYERSRMVRRVGELIREQRGLFGQTIARELGKPLAEAEREADTAAEMFEWAAEEARRSYGRTIPGRTPTQQLTTHWEPVGPVAAFAPWNAPAITPARKISGALAAGCSVVIKPAEETPAAALLIAGAVQSAGVPAGVLNMLFGDPGMISARMTASPIIKALTFTGSTRVGKALAAQAGATLKRLTLELGGHAPVLLFGDVDVESVARAAVAAKFRNCGQVCTSPTRFYIEAGAYPRFAEVFLDAARKLKVGDPLDAATQMGPLAGPRRLETMERLVADARARGVTVATGGERVGSAGWFFAPTVLLDAPDDCLAANEEPFGPLALISPVADVDEALARANRLPQALAAYAFTYDARRQQRIAAELDAGTIAFNHWQASWPETPFGGRGDSGFGVEGGVEGLQAFQQVKFTSHA